jgi:hypothetical protein
MSDKLKCPSFYALPGSLLLGRVGEDGTVGIFSHPLEVDMAFLDQLWQRDIEPETAFRFAGPCHQSACKQWANGACQLIQRLASEPSKCTSSSLPNCGIRGACRWFLQKGALACSVCSSVTRLCARSAENARDPM